MKPSVLAVSLLALCALPTLAVAADGPAAGQAFVRVEAGNGNLRIEDGKDSESVWGLRGGYFFNSNVGVEGFYTSYGKDSEDGVSARLDGYGAGLVLRAPMYHGSKAWLGARLGMGRNRGHASVDGLGDVTQYDTSAYYGVAVGYDFSDRFNLSLNWTETGNNFEVGDDRLHVLAQTVTLGAEYRF